MGKIGEKKDLKNNPKIKSFNDLVLHTNKD
jgi:hypothetical protein